MSLPVRPARESDMAFVIDAWKKSFEGAAAVKGCDRDHYRAEMARMIRRLAKTSTLLMAVAPDDDDQLIGFACFSPTTGGAELHYVYVKQDFRGSGIARALLTGVPLVAFTFLSPTARPRKGLRYTPRFTI